MPRAKPPAPLPTVPEPKILAIRGQRVILDEELARLYGVSTRAFNQAVRRNEDRFPVDFMFQLTLEETALLKSQSVTSSWGGRRKPPYAFTEHGAVQAANVLRSNRAITMSVHIVRAFVRMREALAGHRDLARRLQGLERTLLALDFKSTLDLTRCLWRFAPSCNHPFSPSALSVSSGQTMKNRVRNEMKAVLLASKLY